jgi:Protein of unknown function (DUF1524)
VAVARLGWVLVWAVAVWFPAMGVASADAVKLSDGGICHCPGGSHYERTRNFRAFDTIEACLVHGRHPKSGQGQCQGRTPPSTQVEGQEQQRQDGAQRAVPSGSLSHTDRSPSAPRAAPPYDRDAFGGWADADGDCRDTRAEVLEQLSTGRVWMRSGGCVVDRGRWNDPYTNRVFTDASDVDVDHLVPLSWAWENGAWEWDQATRERFANDRANLFVVDLSANRSKGSDDPTQWLPPNAAFHCEYVTRFERVRRTYQIQLPLDHQRALDTQRKDLCGL